MKKFFLLIALMLVSFGASAQISNVKTKEAIKTITRFRMGLCSLNQNGDTYFLSLRSTGTIEEHELIYLGDGKESVIQTVKDLIELHKSMKKGEFAEYSIKVRGVDKQYKVMKYDRLNFSFVGVKTINPVYLSSTEMKMLVRILEEGE